MRAIPSLLLKEYSELNTPSTPTTVRHPRVAWLLQSLAVSRQSDGLIRPLASST